MLLEKIISQFFDRHSLTQPVLLGLSGGPDSLALFYLLLTYQREKEFQFSVAHIDHGWRVESVDEAKQLKALVEKYNIPFHLRTLCPEDLEGNLEASCRYERLAFFKNLCQEYGYQAVILGHHADDQSETILKKILEGSSLPYLNGMSEVSSYQEIVLWRPLLNCKKAQIKEWLAKGNYNAFEDRTNLDEKYLRGRFRTKIIPDLSHAFGKMVQASLQRIGEESEELKEYLNIQLKKYTDSILKGPFGSLLVFEQAQGLSKFEIKYLIRKVLESEGLRISRHLIEEAYVKILANSANCRLSCKEACLYIDRSRLFVVKRHIRQFEGTILLELGQYKVGDWNIEVKEIEEHFVISNSGWQAAWQGSLQVQLPSGKYFLKRGDASLSKHWTQAKVPAWMRYIFPVIGLEKEIIHEFLTKKTSDLHLNNSIKKWCISLNHQDSRINKS